MSCALSGIWSTTKVCSYHSFHPSPPKSLSFSFFYLLFSLPLSLSLFPLRPILSPFSLCISSYSSKPKQPPLSTHLFPYQGIRASTMLIASLVAVITASVGGWEDLLGWQLFSSLTACGGILNPSGTTNYETSPSVVVLANAKHWGAIRDRGAGM